MVLRVWLVLLLVRILGGELVPGLMLVLVQILSWRLLILRFWPRVRMWVRVQILVVVALVRLLLEERVEIWAHTRLNRGRVEGRRSPEQTNFGGLSHGWDFN